MANGKPLRARLIVAGMMALTGAAFFYGFLSDDMRNTTDAALADVPPGLVSRYIIAMALGGAIAGAICAGLFGRAGVAGWLIAAIGAILASMLAGLLGSAFGLTPELLADGFSMRDVISIGFGLVMIPLSMVDRPYLVAVWLVLIIVTHLWARSARRGA